MYEVPKLQELLERKARKLASREAERIRVSIPEIPGTLHYNDGNTKHAIPWWKIRQEITAAMTDVLYSQHLQAVTEDLMSAVDAVKDLQDNIARIEEEA
jgi:hypothetical protein